MILLIHAPDPAFVKEASKRGIFAYITDAEVDDWQSAIDIVLRRFTEYHDLEGAFGRRAVTERAKGILMERHSVDLADLQSGSRCSTNRAGPDSKIADVASAAAVGGAVRFDAAPCRTDPRASPRTALAPAIADSESLHSFM